MDMFRVLYGGCDLDVVFPVLVVFVLKLRQVVA